MRIMGIDYGDSRIGISISDPFGWTAQGVETIHLKGGLQKALERIHHLIKEYNINKVVVGFPRNMNGTIGPRGEKTLEFIDMIGKYTTENNLSDFEIIKWDERLTTVAANRTMHELGVKTSKKKGVVDQIAAVYILQGYLDSIKK
ncbi:MAG: Holliday junction resolvase RuvX [Clostridia bacterium]|nr:Holliday junction resolvase RuvX [Clostridia bacterium]